MTPRSLKILSASTWGILSICVIVFLYLAITIPNVISESIINDKAKNVSRIQSSTDLHTVQQIATMLTQEEAYISSSARMLLIVAVITLLLCVLCSSVSLFQIRRLRSQFGRQAMKPGKEPSGSQET
jgi:ABC-type Fe3+ transport system permease subunit